MDVFFLAKTITVLSLRANVDVDILFPPDVTSHGLSSLCYMMTQTCLFFCFKFIYLLFCAHCKHSSVLVCFGTDRVEKVSSSSSCRSCRTDGLVRLISVYELVKATHAASNRQWLTHTGRALIPLQYKRSVWLLSLHWHHRYIQPSSVLLSSSCAFLHTEHCFPSKSRTRCSDWLALLPCMTLEVIEKNNSFCKSCKMEIRFNDFNSTQAESLDLS